MWLTKIFYTFLCISLVSRRKSRGLFNPAIAFFMRCFTSSHKNRKAVRVQWRLSTILKISNKIVWSNVFWYLKVCIFWKWSRYTIHWYKTQILKNFLSDKINGTKNVFFFLCELQLIIVSLLICDSYICWSSRFVFLKLCVGFIIFDSVSFLLKFIFLFNKMQGLFDFQNLNNRKATHSFVPRRLIFKLQWEVLKLYDTCVSWSSPKTDQVTNFLNPEDFENFWVVTFKEIFDILLLNNLFISFLNLFISLIELKNMH